MNKQTTILGLALLAALGASAVAAAQDAKLNPKAKIDAGAAAELAVDSAHAAHADAKSARDAAVAARAAEETARTAEGAEIADDAAAIANQSAIDARTSSHMAGNAANAADAAAMIPADPMEADYSVDFATMDNNDDGSVSTGEAASNPTLSAEFTEVDSNHDGRLSPLELEGWAKK